MASYNPSTNDAVQCTDMKDLQNKDGVCSTQIKKCLWTSNIAIVLDFFCIALTIYYLCD